MLNKHIPIQETEAHRPPAAFAQISIALSFLFISGCGNDNVGNAHYYPPCEPPSGVTAMLAYPAPNATGIPANLSEVVFASSGLNGLSSNYLAYLVASPATPGPITSFYAPVGTGTYPPSVIPSPNAIPSASILQVSTNAGITWPYSASVSVYLGAQNGSCNPYTFLGSFTTQTAPPSSSPTPAPTSSS